MAAELPAHSSQSHVALGERTVGMVHDFNNLLTVIDAGLKLAVKFRDQPEKVRVCLAAARDRVKRGKDLTTQLLAFAKERQTVACLKDVNELLRSLELFLRYGAGAGTSIAFDLQSDLPKCLVEPSQFDAAILNIVCNARDAMPNGGEVLIRTDRLVVHTPSSYAPKPGTYVRICLKDNGTGMSDDVVKNVFNPFFTTKGENGSGLGLPQVHAFMRRSGGYINIASKQGLGTTVDLLFPSIEKKALTTQGVRTIR